VAEIRQLFAGTTGRRERALRRLLCDVEKLHSRELEAKDSVIQTLTARKASKGSGVA
jgi:hypothetical protein